VRVQVLGCYGADFYEKENGKGKRYNPSGFLINRSVVLDAGTIVGALTLKELTALRYIFLSHAHFDHIQSLPFLAETLFGKVPTPIVIVSVDEVIDTLKTHFFNDHLWPDFTKLPTGEHPILRYQSLSVGKPMQVEGLKVTAIRVNHIVPAIGFIVEDDHSALVYSGDTWETDEIWKVAAGLDRLKAVFVESSFPDQLGQLAQISGHLTPELTYREFQKIKRADVPLYIYHVKPPYLKEIRKQVKGLKNKNIQLLKDGQVFHF
jgi:ribonuclease BN (tRNA processing enzyme)